MGAAEAWPIATTVETTMGAVGCMMRISTGEKRLEGWKQRSLGCEKGMNNNRNCLKSLRGTGQSLMGGLNESSDHCLCLCSMVLVV